MDVMILAIVFIIYIFALVFVGYYAYKKTNSSEDFMIAGKDTHPFIMAMSYGATFISTAAIVGFGGVASEYGMSVLWLAFLNIIIGVFIAFVFLGKRTRRMGHALDSLTFPEFLGKRFDSKFIHYFSGLIIFCAMPLYAAVVLIGAARFLESSLLIDFSIANVISENMHYVFSYMVAVELYQLYLVDKEEALCRLNKIMKVSGLKPSEYYEYIRDLGINPLDSMTEYVTDIKEKQKSYGK